MIIERTPGRTVPALIAAAAVVVLVACGGGSGSDAAADGPLIRDSIGIHYVEYPGGWAPPTVFFPPEPIYRHGDSDGDYLFSRPYLGRLQPDGSAVVTDGRGTEVVVISPDGSSFEMLAASGEGPDEVRAVQSILVLAQDHIFIEDDGNAKFAFFEDGELVATYSTAGDFTIGGAVRAEDFDADGHLLMTTAGFRPGFSGAWLDGHLVHRNLDAPAPDTVGSYDLVPAALPEGPFDPFNPRGFATASGGRFVYGRSDRPELRWWNPDGTLHQYLSWRPERRNPTDADFADFARQLAVDMRRVNPHLSDEQVSQVLTDQLGLYQVRYSAPLPIFSSIFGDGAGGVWLAEYAPSGDIRRYEAINARGEWVGTMMAPAGFRLLDVVGNRVLGSLKDALDVESVVVFEVATPLP